MNTETHNPKPVPFDLEERTAHYGERVVAYARSIPVDEITRPLIGQLVRSGTRVGANYCEADDADSKKGFRFKIGICPREAKKCAHWLRMTFAASPIMREPAKPLWKEARELNLIFGAIRRKTKGAS